METIRKPHDKKLLSLELYNTDEKLRRDIKFTNTFFKENSKLCIVKSGKGGSIIVVTKSEYIEEIKSDSKDTTMYEYNKKITEKKGGG